MDASDAWSGDAGLAAAGDGADNRIELVDEARRHGARHTGRVRTRFVDAAYDRDQPRVLEELFETAGQLERLHERILGGCSLAGSFIIRA